MSLMASAAVSSPSNAVAEPIDVSVSILPQAYLASRVAGDLARVHVLVPVGQSPHSFEISPQQMADLAGSRVYFAVGIQFEERVLEKLERMNPGLVVVQTGEGVPTRSMVEGGHTGGGVPERSTTDDERHEPGGRQHDAWRPDPHIWLNPRFASVMTENIRDGLASVDPGNAAAYEANSRLLMEDLRELDEEIARTFEPHAGRSFYVFHPAFGYFADRYRLVQTPIEIAGKEPGIRGLISFVERARADGARTIFTQIQFPDRAAAAAAAEVGAEIVALDPLPRDYIEGLRDIAENVRVSFILEEAEHQDR